MKKVFLSVCCIMFCMVSTVYAAGDFRGDERCPLPKDWNNYSEPYEPLNHPADYPLFPKADWPGWSCSWQRDDGVIVQYGDSRTPQEQWIAVWGNSVSID